MLDSEDEEPHVKGLNGGLQGREWQEKLDDWIMAVSKTKESHSKASSFAKILIFESMENSKDVFHKRSTKCRRKEK